MKIATFSFLLLPILVKFIPTLLPSSFNENLDYPEKDEKYFKYVNSKMENGNLKLFLREIIKEDIYEHKN